MTGRPGEAASRTLMQRLVRTALTAAAVLLPLAGVVAVLVARAPAWWGPVPRADAAAAERAAAFEQGIVSEFTRVRGDAAEWALRVRESDVNDWLGTRLPAWLDSRGEAAPVAVQCRMQVDAVVVGVQTGPLVAWWQAGPVPRDGGLGLQREQGGVGRLTIPGIAGLLQPNWRDQVLGQPIRLADGRRVRVLDLESLPGEVRLRLRTEPASRP